MKDVGSTHEIAREIDSARAKYAAKGSRRDLEYHANRVDGANVTRRVVDESHRVGGREGGAKLCWSDGICSFDIIGDVASVSQLERLYQSATTEQVDRDIAAKGM